MVLETLELGPRILTSIMTLYSTPCAQVKGNYIFSSWFPVRNSMRQEWPLSPLLFALVLEPLLGMVRASKDIKGLPVGNTDHKLSLMLAMCYFTSWTPWFHCLTWWRNSNILDSFSTLRLITQSEILPIQLTPSLTNNLQTAFPFTWAKSSLRYLGIQLTGRFDTLYAANFPLLLNAVKWDLSQ